MTTQEVYERYKHLDEFLSKGYVPETVRERVITDLWQAIKEAVEKP